MAKDVFISYARDDQKIAAEICEALEERHASVWMAPKSIPPGANFEESILQGITGARVMLLVLSNAANESQFVANEVNHAFTAKKTIITYRTADIIPDGPLKFYTSRAQWVSGYEGSFNRNMDLVAEAIRALPGSSNGAPAGTASEPVAVTRRVSKLAKLRSLFRHMQIRERLAWGVAATLAVGMAVFAFLYLHHSPAEAPETHLEINTPPTDDPYSLAVSPDGQRLVYVTSKDGKSQLWVRPLDSTTAQPLAGTENAAYPFWSPDSASIGFFADGKLKRIDIAGGASQTLATAAATRGGTWNREGIIVFEPHLGPLFRVSATGGEPIPITRLAKGQGAHRFPQFLPDGQHFIYLATPSQTQGIYVGSLDGAAPKRLTTADEAPVVYPAPPQQTGLLGTPAAGFLLFPRGGTLFAQAFDFKRLELSGNPFPVAEQVALDPTVYASGFSANSTIIAYRTGGAFATRQLTWLDRSGKMLGTVGSPDTAGLGQIALSPDERQVATERTVSGNADIWIFDVGRGVPTRFTFDPANDQRPLWSPDGGRIVWSSNRTGPLDLYSKLSSGAGSDELLLASDRTKSPTDWSRDGRFLLFQVNEPDTGWDLWVLPMSGANASPIGRSDQGMSGDKKPFPFLRTPFNERSGQFSPDGKWIAYQSDESGRYEIYAQPFPGPGGKYQISTNGGAQVRWNHNGKEIFYVSLDSKMMSAPVTLSADGKSLQSGSPNELFPVHIAGGPVVPNNGQRQEYAVSADGKRFLVNLAVSEGTATSPITVISNWKPKAAQ